MSSEQWSVDWKDDFALSSEIREVGGQSHHYRSINAGEQWRVARGAYLPQEPTSDEARYLAQIRGRSLVARNSPVFSHFSAARLWSLPIFGTWPMDVHVEVGGSRNGKSIPGLRRHRSGGPLPVRPRAGLLVTSLARTVVDVASTSSLRTAVVVVDAALSGMKGRNDEWVRHPVSKDELIRELELRGSFRGSRQLSWAIDFGDGLSGSPGESISRLTMFQIGCPAPELQHTFRDRNGKFVATTDFWWPDYNLTGEFDGRGKYLRDELTGGRTAAEVVVDEKVREDALRALGPRMSRWVWEEALSPHLLRRKLTSAGLPCVK